MSKKYCYLFTEGNAQMRELLGGKGANLAEMTNIGLPVPQGFTITTEACTQYYEDGRQINDEIMAEIMEYIEKMEKITGKKFGDHENPLLVSVRSCTTFWIKPRPMFLTAASPKRIPSAPTEKWSLDALRSGGRTEMPITLHSAIYSEIFTELSSTEVISAAIYSRG